MPEYSLKSLVKWLRLEYPSLETISSTESFVAVRRLFARSILIAVMYFFTLIEKYLRKAEMTTGALYPLFS